MNREKLKCIKCGLRFRDREDPEDKGLVNREMCWNCRFVWKVIGLVLRGLPERLNRDVAINLDYVIIKKKIK